MKNIKEDMAIRIRFTGILLVLGLFASAQKQPSALPRPKLVVGIVVDQMRWDYLYRYYSRYKPNGFKRLLNEGFSCENTYINYLPSVTAIGHSSIYTGSVPAIHGITGNDFLIEATGKNMYCTEDTSVSSVGTSSNEGKMSPRNLLASTITDELKLATNFKSKVISISLKDRGSILPAGHAANAAYWFDNATGNWISSTFYMKELPAWVRKMNDQKLTEKYLKQDWNTLYDINTYVQSSPDDNRYEGKYQGKSTSTFPVKTSGMFTSKNYEIIRSTPYGNSLTLDLAKAAIENEQLGKGGTTDFLAVSCSSTDLIGHKTGLLSVEVEDTYLRLDIDLANFFTYLDTKIGKGNYTLFLTADHGAGHNPNLLIDNRLPGGYWIGSQTQRDLNTLLEDKFKIKNIVTSFSNSQVHLNHKIIAQNRLDENAIKTEIVDFLILHPSIAFAVVNNKLEEAAVPAYIKNLITNSYNPKRSGAITIILQPGWYSGSSPSGTGSAHASWNPHDTHIPLVWMGWGIKHGSSNRHINITDIAPTLAALLHIQEPNGCVGVPIEEVLK